MKKRTKVFTTVTLLGLLLAGCAASAAQGKRIDKEAAKEAALADAGVKAEDVLMTSLELDRRNGVEYYEVDFVADGAEYDYEIDALTGEVIFYEVEKQGKPQTVKKTPAVEKEVKLTVEPLATPVIESQVEITEEEAKKIALAKVPGADESHIFKFGTDYDDGRLEYEGTIIFEEMEYEFEIDAESGDFRNWEQESIYD